MNEKPQHLGGYVRLYRALLDNPIVTRTNTLQVFIVLLLRATFRPAQFMGIPLKPGQAIMGRKELAFFCGLTENQIRTAMDHLCATNTITIQTTNQFTIVTFPKWSQYQGNWTPLPERTTSETTNENPGEPPHRKPLNQIYKKREEEKEAPKGDSPYGENEKALSRWQRLL